MEKWSEKVEDLVDSGDIDSAISLLETLISTLQTTNPQLSPALLELSKLYSSKGLSLKSDDLRSRAAVINLQSLSSTDVCGKEEGVRVSSNRTQVGDTGKGDDESCAKSSNDNVAPQEESDDDWEAMADRAPDELLAPQSLPEVSKLSLNDTKPKVPHRRGRGTFTYRKNGLYSDHQDDDSVAYDSPDEAVHETPENSSAAKNSIYGTHHVIVLDGFQPSTTTTDLERLFEDFRERGFAIRWVNDTLALAVFPTPSVAREALNSVRCPFSVRVLEEDDHIMSSISVKDLDPPRQRPKTSARTAQRLIAHELGVKLPSTFGSREFRNQEDARRNRIVTRQHLKDEAWGPDDTNYYKDESTIK